MSNVRILTNNGQLNGSIATFGSTVADGSGTLLQTTYLPKSGDNLQVYRYVVSTGSTTATATGNVASIALPSGGVGLTAGRYGQLTIRLTILIINDSAGTPLITPIMDQYMLSTGVDGSGNTIQPPYFSQLLGTSITQYIPTSYFSSTVTPSNPGFSLVDSSGVLTLTVASSTSSKPGSTFDVISDFSIISSNV